MSQHVPTNLYFLPIGEDAPDIVDVVIEVPRGSANKYEYDHEAGVFRLDRVLYSPMHYPGDYGFLPGTYADDGDPLDAVVLTTIPTFPGCVLRARPVGYLDMTDDKGRDEKLLVVPADDPRFDEVRDLSDVAPHIPKEIEHFFSRYKDLEGKETTMGGWHGRDEVRELVETCQRQFREKFGE